MLPGADDADRLAAEAALAQVRSIRDSVRRLVAIAAAGGGPATGAVEDFALTVRVVNAPPAGQDDGEAYLAVEATIWDAAILAVILDSVPGVPAGDWQIEPTEALGISPAPTSLVYSAMIPAAALDALAANQPATP
jgi:hypothetical protein